MFTLRRLDYQAAGGADGHACQRDRPVGARVTDWEGEGLGVSGAEGLLETAVDVAAATAEHRVGSGVEEQRVWPGANVAAREGKTADRYRAAQVNCVSP